MPLSKPFIYLASQSLRRKEILKKMGISFCIVPSRYRERPMPRLSPRQLVIQHAQGKVRKAILPPKARWVLGADTMVVFKHHILGKPKSRKEAFRMISLLSGKSHFVYTGVALWDRKNQKIKTAVAKTKVYFKRLDKNQILSYLEQINPLDKAGAYAIQEGPKIVRKIEGSRSNVIGLPVELIKKMLK